MFRSIITVIASASSLLALQLYLHLNIVEFDAGNSGTLLLATYFFLGFPALSLRPSVLRHFLMPRRQDLPLGCFLALVFLKITIEHPNENQLFSYSFGTSGGILFFFLVGLILSLNPLFCFREAGEKSFLSANEIPRFSFVDRISLLSMLFIVGISLFLTFQEFKFYADSLRPDLFVVDPNMLGGEIVYQRIGDFLSIKLVVIALVLMASTYSHCARTRSSFSALMFFCTDVLVFACALASVLCSLLTALAVGSNKSAIIAIALLPIMIYVSFSRRSQFLRKLGRVTLETLSHILRLRVARLIKVALPLMVSFFAIYSSINLLENSEFLSVTRLTRFGDEGGALGPRLKILIENSWIHFDVAPLWGHIYADGLTTGSGSYVHSLPVYLMNHTGVVGLALFSLFVVGYLKNAVHFIQRYQTSSSGFSPGRCAVLHLFAEGIARELLLYLSIVAVLMAIVGTSVFWGYLWFCIGCLYRLSR